MPPDEPAAVGLTLEVGIQADSFSIPARTWGAIGIERNRAVISGDMPEGPAIAGFRSLDEGADLVDGTLVIARFQRAVGANERRKPVPWHR